MRAYLRPTVRRASVAFGLIVGLLALASARADEGEPGRRPRSDEAYEQLIHRLEMGMSALKELGRHEELEALARVADQVRAERREARERREAHEAREAPAGPVDHEEPSLDARERRMEILRWARDAHQKAGRAEAVHLLARAVELAELQQSGRHPDVVEREAAAFPMRDLVGVLRKAGGLYGELGYERRAAACRALADWYAAHWNLPTEGAVGGLDTREKRVKVLELARTAHAAVGHEEAVALLDRMIRVGRLQIRGASDAEVAEAAQGLTMERVIDLLASAGDLYAGWNMPDRAVLCRKLAAFYQARDAAREREEPGDDAQRAGHGEEDEETEEREDATMQEAHAMEHVRAVMAEVQKLREEVEALRHEVERLRRPDR
jgi:hypothetical protein